MFSAFASPGLARGTTPEEVSRRLQAQRNGGGMGGMPGQMPGGGGLSGLPGGYAGMTAASQARARAMGGLPGPGAAPAGRMMGGTLPPGWQPPGQGQPAGTAGGMPAPMGGGFGVPQFNQFAGGGMPAPGYMG
jgi:suppressor of tumorigenicity protein 13